MNSETVKKYFSCSTILNQMLQVQKRLDCFKLCTRQNNCEYLKYKLNNCSLYLFLSFYESLKDGSFWFKNKNDKIFTDSTITNEICNYSLLTRNYPISNLTNNGFQIVYDQFYSHSTIYSDICLRSIEASLLGIYLSKSTSKNNTYDTSDPLRLSWHFNSGG
ncbi:unnamed protein product [Brachionus calyciflorus]|uniref:Uncharacterized protein n=1 Tax=Brachionus calyciflorus TaxID=104777 RepID=A0A814I2F3_9BILA|nr:unnamed protein product [Brachionus calyciflorus]